MEKNYTGPKLQPGPTVAEALEAHHGPRPIRWRRETHRARSWAFEPTRRTLVDAAQSTRDSTLSSFSRTEATRDLDERSCSKEWKQRSAGLGAELRRAGWRGLRRPDLAGNELGR